MDPETGAKTLLAGNPLALTVDGQTYQILPEEVEVRAQAKSASRWPAKGH